MRCIFCKSTTDGSRSEEHIIPESFGNVEHVLPRGWVCDGCNNYLAREVEGPFLNSWYGRNWRFHMRVRTKRGHLPPAIGVHCQSGATVELSMDDHGTPVISGGSDKDGSRFVRSIVAHERGNILFPAAECPLKNYETSRFIGKVGLEVLAYRGMGAGGWNREIVEKKELDELRRYVRQGKPGFIWPIHVRRIYPARRLFASEDSRLYEVLHEWSLLPIQVAPGSQEAEFYAVIAIFGVEYAINLGGPELEGLESWLRDNCGASCLYPEGLPQLPREAVGDDYF